VSRNSEPAEAVACRDPERIWLEPPPGGSEGRTWCEDKVWPIGVEDEEPTEYIRADLATPAPSASGGLEAVAWDDLAVDRFAYAMKAKLAKKRAEGYGGWDHKIPDRGLDGRGFHYECPNSFLSEKLREHVDKGDPVDVANFAMMLHQRAESIVAAPPSQAEIDRDALLQAIGFTGGPLGDGLRRSVILSDAGRLRGAMVEARRSCREVEGDAMLWQASLLDGHHMPLLLRVWQQRRDAQKQARELAAHLDRVTTVALTLIREVEDPGSEALAATYFARGILLRLGLAPSAVAPLLDERMWWFLAILRHLGGSAEAGDESWNWIGVFCDDRGDETDTYNLSEILAFTSTTHDSLNDSSTVHLTADGIEALVLDPRTGLQP
jgi:hypothetical protein